MSSIVGVILRIKDKGELLAGVSFEANLFSTVAKKEFKVLALPLSS